MGDKETQQKFCKRCMNIQPVKHTPRGRLGGTRDRITIECQVCDQYLGGYDAQPPKRKEGDPAPPRRTDTLTDASMMPFGPKYGPKSNDPRKLGDVPGDYLLFIAEQPWMSEWPGLQAYIEANRQRLEDEQVNQTREAVEEQG